MPDYIKTSVSSLEIGDAVMWRGKVCKVVERLGPALVKVQEFVQSQIAEGKMKQKFYSIHGDLDKVQI